MDKNTKHKDRKKHHLTLLGKIVFSLLGICALAVVLLGLRWAYIGIESMLPIDSTLDAFSAKALNREIVSLNAKEKRLDIRMCKSPDLYQDRFAQELSQIFDIYALGNCTYDQAMSAFSAYKLFDFCSDKADFYINNAKSVKEGRQSLIRARDFKKNSDFFSAIEQYLTVPSADRTAFAQAQGEAAEVFKQALPQIQQKLGGFLACFKTDMARSYAQSLVRLLGQPAQALAEAVEQYEAFQTNTVEYKGPVEHVFTHCLIAFPELCYSSPSMTKALDTDCITPKEFTAILENLYQKGYILIDINLLYDQSTGSIASLKLPKGKKPLVLSIDDVTYDSRKMHTGMVDKLIVDQNGDVCTYTLQDGREIISYDNEVFPIVNAFVRKHPDFSFRGARGTLCNTGFDGVFGYRTQSEPIGNEKGIDRQSEIQQAKIVAESLKNEGWTFASHGFGHRHMSQISPQLAAQDTDSWQKEVVPIVGPTQVMVWPYGDHVRKGEVHEYLYNAGFRIFCGVGSKPYLAKEPDGLGIFMDRKALDGYSLRNRRESYMYLFDAQEVWDPLRPKELP